MWFNFILLLLGLLFSCDPDKSNTVSSQSSASFGFSNDLGSNKNISDYTLDVSYEKFEIDVNDYKGIYTISSLANFFPVDSFSANFDYSYQFKAPLKGLRIETNNGKVFIEDIYSLSSAIDLNIDLKISKDKKVLTNININFSGKINIEGYNPIINQYSLDSVQVFIPKLYLKNKVYVYHSRNVDLSTEEDIKNSNLINQFEIENIDKYVNVKANFKDGINYLYLLYTYNDGNSYMIKKLNPFSVSSFFAFSNINFNNKKSDLIFDKIPLTGDYTYKIYEFDRKIFSGLKENFIFKSQPLSSSTGTKISIDYKDSHNYLLVSSNHSTSENIILSQCSVLDQFYVVATNITKQSADITCFPFYNGNKNEFIYKIYFNDKKPKTLAEVKNGTYAGEIENFDSISLTGLKDLSTYYVSAIVSNKNFKEEYFFSYGFVTGAELYWDATVGIFATNKNVWKNLSEKGSSKDGTGEVFSFNFEEKYFLNVNSNGSFVFEEIDNINAVFVLGNFTHNSSSFLGDSSANQWQRNSSSPRFFSQGIVSKIGGGKFWKNEMEISNPLYFTREEDQLMAYGILLNNGGNLNTGIKASQLSDRDDQNSVWKGKFKKLIIFKNAPTEKQMQNIANFLVND